MEKTWKNLKNPEKEGQVGHSLWSCFVSPGEGQTIKAEKLSLPKKVFPHKHLFAQTSICWQKVKYSIVFTETKRWHWELIGIAFW